MSTYDKQTIEKCRKFRQVTPNGVVYDWWLVSSEGAGFALLREPHHTDEDIETAKQYLRRERDVIVLRVYMPEKT